MRRDFADTFVAFARGEVTKAEMSAMVDRLNEDIIKNYGLCVRCDTPQSKPVICGSKTNMCPACGYPWPLGDCSD